VRTPSRIEKASTINGFVLAPGTRDNPLPVPLLWGLKGNGDPESQVLIAYEAGYRFIPNEVISFDTAIFYNDYDKLRTVPPEFSFNGTYAEAYGRFQYDGEGSTHGLELAVAWQALPSLKVDLAYSLIYEDLPDIHVSFTSEAPTNQLSLQANWQLTDTLAVDFWGRYVDKLRAIYSGDIMDSAYPIDDYFTIDLQLRYSPSQDLEIALIGQNLLQKSHEEYVQEYYTLPAEVERGVYMKVTYRF
jgi:iron complex outermembrane receptor protein